MPVSLFERIGGKATVERLVDAYLEVLRTNPANSALCAYYCHGFDHYKTRMQEYITGFLGGPALYMQNHGMPQLREQHQKLAITPELRDLWFGCMNQALEMEITDAALRRELAAVFWNAADSMRNS